MPRSVNAVARRARRKKIMKQFKEIEKEDNNFHITKHGNKVVVEDKLGSVAK